MAVLAMVPAAAGETHSEPGLPAFPLECLVIGPLTQAGRTPFHEDAVEAEIVAGTWHAPAAGQAVRLKDGQFHQWTRLRADVHGAFASPALEGGYASVPVLSRDPRVVVLEATGHSMVYVNGEPRVGDPYGLGYVRIPVQLRRGVNSFLFAVGRGRVRAKLTPARSAAMLHPGDVTLPDLPADQAFDTEGAIVVLNATTAPAERLVLRVRLNGGSARQLRVPPIPPLGIRKIPFPVAGPPCRPGTTCELELELREGRTPASERSDAGRPLDEAKLNLRVCRPGETYRRTFRSEIDGSVQYYAVTPASGASRAEKPALVLTLHGAGVEAFGQACCYRPKPWAHIVAPTNRRPFGFDWEDWGRLDALEVLDLAARLLGTDPRRVYLTGHSMGGHGVWHLAATYPDRFAAIGPSAGWVSMWSYAGARHPTQPGPVPSLLERAATPSDTLALVGNFERLGIYVLHGDKDDNVPVEQARLMKSRLTGHADLVYHEQPDAGHWWGNACVDWQPMFDFFRSHQRADAARVRSVDFTTASPGASASCCWAAIECQEQALRPSSIHLRWDPGRGRLTGQTQNVARLSLDPEVLGPVTSIELDRQAVGPVRPSAGRLWLVHERGGWHGAPRPAGTMKGPLRYGPFKEVFRHEVQLVYGTGGTAEENAWMLAKARYDAESFWYRGNGALNVVADRSFDPAAARDRNIVLYGNRDSNLAWGSLSSEGTVLVERGRVRVGTREVRGENIGCLVVRPRSQSDRALLGFVGGTGLAGMRVMERVPYFVSGIGYPDWILCTPAVLTDRASGVLGAGFFGPDWGVETGESAWQDRSAPSGIRAKR